MKPYLLLLLTGSLLMTSCKAIMIRGAGVRTPKQETPGSLTKYLSEINGPLQNNYIPADSSAWRKIIRNPHISKTFTGTFIFTHEGIIVNPIDSGACQWSGVGAIALLDPDSTYITDTSFTIMDLEPLLVPLAEGNLPSGNDPQDFTVVMTWARFMRKFNNRIFFAREMVQKNHKARIRLVFLNLDMQKSWMLKPDQVLKIQ